MMIEQYFNIRFALFIKKYGAKCSFNKSAKQFTEHKIT